jgi:putative nucleotide binding protein
MSFAKGKRVFEEYGYVLDFVEEGRVLSRLGKPVHSPYAQLLGDVYFTLLEVSLFPHVKLSPKERVFIGKGNRAQVKNVLGRIRYGELTPQARFILPDVAEFIIVSNEQRFIDLLNSLQSISPKMHAIELLPGIGKMNARKILEERARKPFSSFEDFSKRIGIQGVAKLMAQRVVEELSTEVKYRIFTRD